MGIAPVDHVGMTTPPLLRPVDAAATGITRAALVSHRFARLHHGLYVADGTPLTPTTLVRAALLAVPSVTDVLRIGRGAKRA